MEPNVAAALISGVVATSFFLYYSFKPRPCEPFIVKNSKSEKKEKKKNKKESKKQKTIVEEPAIIRPARKSIELETKPILIDDRVHHEPSLDQKPKKTILKNKIVNENILSLSQCQEYEHNIEPKDELEILHSRHKTSSVDIVGDDNVSPWTTASNDSEDEDSASDQIVPTVSQKQHCTTASNTSPGPTQKEKDQDSKIQALNKTISNLKSDNQKLSSEVKEISSELKKHENESKNAKIKISMMEKNLIQKTNELDDKLKMISSLKADRDMFKKSADSMKNEMEKLSEKLFRESKENNREYENVRAQINKLNNENQMLKLSLNQVNEEKQNLLKNYDNELMKSQSSAFRENSGLNKIHLLEQRNKEMSENIRSTQEKLQEYFKINNNLKTNLEFFQNEVNNFKISRQELEISHKTVVESLQEDLKRERCKLTQLANENKDLSAKLCKCNENINSLTQELTTTQKKCLNLESQICQLTNLNKTLEKQVIESSETLKSADNSEEVKALKSRLEQRETESNNLKREMKILESSFQSLKAELTSLKKKASEDTKDQYKELYEKLLSENTALKEEVVETVKMKESMNDVLTNLSEIAKREETKWNMILRSKDSEIKALAVELNKLRDNLSDLQAKNKNIIETPQQPVQVLPLLPPAKTQDMSKPRNSVHHSLHAKQAKIVNSDNPNVKQTIPSPSAEKAIKVNEVDPINDYGIKQCSEKKIETHRVDENKNSRKSTNNKQTKENQHEKASMNKVEEKIVPSTCHTSTKITKETETTKSPASLNVQGQRAVEKNADSKPIKDSPVKIPLNNGSVEKNFGDVAKVVKDSSKNIGHEASKKDQKPEVEPKKEFVKANSGQLNGQSTNADNNKAFVDSAKQTEQKLNVESKTNGQKTEVKMKTNESSKEISVNESAKPTEKKEKVEPKINGRKSESKKSKNENEIKNSSKENLVNESAKPTELKINGRKTESNKNMKTNGECKNEIEIKESSKESTVNESVKPMEKVEPTINGRKTESNKNMKTNGQSKNLNESQNTTKKEKHTGSNVARVIEQSSTSNGLDSIIKEVTSSLNGADNPNFKMDHADDISSENKEQISSQEKENNNQAPGSRSKNRNTLRAKKQRKTNKMNTSKPLTTNTDHNNGTDAE